MQLAEREEAFENSEFYRLLAVHSVDSVSRALDLLLNGCVDVRLRSRSSGRAGSNYVHQIVELFHATPPEQPQLQFLLVRGLYRLVLAGLDINARDANGDTALVRAASVAPLNQLLMQTLLRLGELEPSASRDGISWSREGSVVERGCYLLVAKCLS